MYFIITNPNNNLKKKIWLNLDSLSNNLSHHLVSFLFEDMFDDPINKIFIQKNLGACDYMTNDLSHSAP